ncbi:hypothetical protein H072_8174 [Dactylellina haptotyla CBS 200.50]|uniref:Uncharacterized protein n=1 Tax=Dactylellina haptotyla (strain CBS 200.50) TaxID=1284197 RepID=S8AAE8_DACHA|nr:hypothetical protein H072_8174 [Dactylellina haptotyla CBS 200.50]
MAPFAIPSLQGIDPISYLASIIFLAANQSHIFRAPSLVSPLHKDTEYGSSIAYDGTNILPRQFAGFKGSVFEDWFWKIALLVMFSWVVMSMICGSIVLGKKAKRTERKETIKMLRLRAKYRLKEMGLEVSDSPMSSIVPKKQKWHKRLKEKLKRPLRGLRDWGRGNDESLPVPPTPIPWDNYRSLPFIRPDFEAEELDTRVPMSQAQRANASPLVKCSTVQPRFPWYIDKNAWRQNYPNLPIDYLAQRGFPKKDTWDWEAAGEEPHMKQLARRLHIFQALAEGKDYCLDLLEADTDLDIPQPVRIPVEQPEVNGTHPWDDYDTDLHAIARTHDSWYFDKNKVPLKLKPLRTNLSPSQYKLKGPAGLPLPDATRNFEPIREEDEGISPRTTGSGGGEIISPGMRGNSPEGLQGSTVSTALNAPGIEIEPPTPVGDPQSTSLDEETQSSKENKPPSRGRK